MTEITVNTNVVIPAAIGVTAGFTGALSFVAAEVKDSMRKPVWQIWNWLPDEMKPDSHTSHSMLSFNVKTIECIQLLRKTGKIALGVAALAGLVAVVNYFRNQK